MFVYSGDGDTRVNIQGKQEEDNEEDVTKPEKIEPTCSGTVDDIRSNYLQSLEELPLAPEDNIEMTPSSSPSAATAIVVSETTDDGQTTQSLNDTSLGTIGTPDGELFEYYRINKTSDGKLQYFDIDDIFIVEY